VSGGRGSVGLRICRVDDLLGSFRRYDTLCINQGDIEEKIHEVRLMQTVYASAANDLSWL
jgi:hypothetical protein